MRDEIKLDRQITELGATVSQVTIDGSRLDQASANDPFASERVLEGALEWIREAFYDAQEGGGVADYHVVLYRKEPE